MFSGIGGAELAAEWNGIENKFHCDINEFGRQVLDYWYPDSKSYGDIKKTDFSEWRGKIDILSGGFPCQPFSTAGRRRGAGDDRYLWPEMLRVIAQVQPRYVVGENVAGITSMVEFPRDCSRVEKQKDLFGEDYRVETRRGRYTLERVCGDLEEAGYSVQPIIIPACAVNAPHRRDRVWILAKRDGGPASAHGDSERPQEGAAQGVRDGRGRQAVGEQGRDRLDAARNGVDGTAHDTGTRPLARGDFEKFPTQPPLCLGDDGVSVDVADAPVFGEPRHGRRRWVREALKALGNAWVPQVAAEIFAAIVKDMENDSFHFGNCH